MAGSHGRVGEDGARDTYLLPRVPAVGDRFLPGERPEMRGEGHALTHRLQRAEH